MKEVDIFNISENVVDLIGRQWMLVTAGNIDHYNTMTASWGSIGFLWGKPVATIFIRPQRYTYSFIEEADCFTLSFFEERYRPALNLCGQKSGRDIDKASESGLTPFAPAQGVVSFKQARIVIKCRKLFKTELKKEDFIETGIIPKWYPQSDFHYMYIAAIESLWIQEL